MKTCSLITNKKTIFTTRFFKKNINICTKSNLNCTITNSVNCILLFTISALTLCCNHPKYCVDPKSRSVTFRNRTKTYVEFGKASWYGGNNDGFAGNLTANQEIYDPSALTCAHRTLPFGTLVHVENLTNDKCVILRVNDRGPFINGRILDISHRAAQELGILDSGTTDIRLHTVNKKGRPISINLAVVQGNPYTIQVASLSNPLNIDRLSRELNNMFGTKVNRVNQNLNGISITRFMVGTFYSLEEAENGYRKLNKFCKKYDLKPFITRQY